MKRTLKVGTRGSPLALAQVEEVQRLLLKKRFKLNFEVILFETKGDKDRKTPLTANLPDDFFTDTLDQALLNRQIDIAIHSAKDLPQQMREGLSVFALTQSLDETDAFLGTAPLKLLKRGARVGTSSNLRQQSVKALNSKIRISGIRGNIETRLKQLDQGKYEGIIVATCALKRLGLAKRITEIMPWEATPLQGQLAVVARSEDQNLASLFSCIDVREKYGTVFLVGSGPGDADLITAKGINALKQAEVVFYDYLINKEQLKYARKAEKIYVGKRKGKHTLAQSDLNRLIKEKAMAGKMVVRLKGGDPLIFGRGGDEIDYLRSYHIHVEVIPGVSSATAIPSSLGIPLTARGLSDSVAFVSGHSEGESKGRRKKIHIPKAKTLIFLMGLTKLKEIVSQLKRKRWKSNTPVIVISKGTCADEKVVCGQLSDIVKQTGKEKLKPPALIIVGETVRFYRPFHKRDKTVLYTGTNPKKYKKLGNLIHLPMIELSGRRLSQKEKENFAHALTHTDIVLLTSRFAVHYFFEIVRMQKLNVKKQKFVVIGRTSAEALLTENIRADLIAKDEFSEGLFKAMKRKYDLKGKRILFARSSLANPFLKEALTKEGAKVKEIPIYQNKKPTKRHLPRTSIDEVVFTSPSTVKNFLRDYGTIPSAWTIKSRGPLTKRQLERAGFKSEALSNE